MTENQTQQFMKTIMGGYTEEQLQDAFNKVKNPDDWKAPIKATVEVEGPEEVELICFAVNFYTATPCDACDEPDGKATFTAPGYRRGPAA